MHLPINVKSPNNISKWQMEFNSAFKGLISISPYTKLNAVTYRRTRIYIWKRRQYKLRVSATDISCYLIINCFRIRRVRKCRYVTGKCLNLSADSIKNSKLL
jgi:hypothetical protein